MLLFLCPVKKFILIFLITTMSINTEAQSAVTVAGEYYLRGVMETASGFKLNEDGTFDFFFSYGALDRSGSGNWKVKDSTVILTSPKPTTQSFALVTNKAISSDLVTIKVIEENPFFKSNVYVLAKGGGKQLEGQTDKNGVVTFPKQALDTIVLLFEFTPEKAAVFAFNNKNENYFEFRFEPTVMEVFFEDLTLTIDGTGLKGSHPLLKEGVYTFQKH